MVYYGTWQGGVVNQAAPPPPNGSMIIARSEPLPGAFAATQAVTVQAPQAPTPTTPRTSLGPPMNSPRSQYVANKLYAHSTSDSLSSTMTGTPNSSLISPRSVSVNLSGRQSSVSGTPKSPFSPPRPGSVSVTPQQQPPGAGFTLNLAQTMPIYAPSATSTPRMWTPRETSTTITEESQGTKPIIRMESKDGETSQSITINTADTRSTVDSIVENMVTGKPEDTLSKSSTLILRGSSSWTYPALKHVTMTPRRRARPHSSSPSRLPGNTQARLKAAAKRRELLGSESSCPALKNDPQTPVTTRPPARCFDDLYADALERHRRFTARVSRFLEQEDAEVGSAVMRAKEEYKQNQARVPGNRDPDSPKLGSMNRQLRSMEVLEQRLASEQEELQECTFRPQIITTNSVKRSSSANLSRSHNYGTQTARRSKSVGWTSGSVGARCVDNKAGTPESSGTPPAMRYNLYE